MKAYIIGDRLLVDRFRRLVNNRFAEAFGYIHFEPPFSYRSYSYAFANIPPDRPILQYMVDDLCTRWPDDADEDALDEASLQAFNDLPKSYTIQAMLRLGEYERNSDKARRRRCYYEHESEEERKDCTVGLHMKYNAVLDYGAFE
jgi:hypothetical protein